MVNIHYIDDENSVFLASEIHNVSLVLVKMFKVGDLVVHHGE